MHVFNIEVLTVLRMQSSLLPGSVTCTSASNASREMHGQAGGYTPEEGQEH